jgi:4-hydroxy-4-methyl-2-oxoglutarate aldolase
MSEEAIIQTLAAISSATLHEAMGKQHTMWPSIRPLWRPLSLCGPAFTVQARPGDNLAVHWALAVAPPGSVLVVTHEGDNSCGGWGEIASVAALARGLRGLITDGAVRDTGPCRQLGFPIFSQGVSIKGTTKAFPGAVNVPIVCAGASVRPGDYVVADEDGVVVIPRDQAQTLARQAQERDRREAEIMERLRAGDLTVDLLGLRGKLLGLRDKLPAL